MRIKTRNIGRKAASLALTALFSATFLAGSFNISTDGVSASASSSEESSSGYSLDFTNSTGSVDLTDIKLSNLSSSVLKDVEEEYGTTKATVFVQLEEDAAINGGSETTIAEQQSDFLYALGKAGISYTFKSSYSNILNAVAIEADLSDVVAVSELDGVTGIALGTTYARPDETSSSDSGSVSNTSKIYKTGIYDSSAYVEQGIDGRGMTVAIIDTGLDYTHEAFDPDDMEDKELTTEGYFTSSYIEETLQNDELKAETRSGATAEDVYVNAKVPFAYDYADNDADVYPSYSQHGTHVAGIIAGKSDSYTDKDGNVAVDENGNKISFRGVAPEAQLVICKVFTDDLDDNELGSAQSEDILDALEDCTKLGVDIINMSLGTTSGFTSQSLGLSDNDLEGILTDTVYENIRNAGISLIVAASNDFSSGYGSDFGTNLATNPDSGTVGSPSTYDGAVSVASINGQYSPYIIANASDSSSGSAIYYEESRNEDSDAYDFVDEMLDDGVQSATFTYVVVSGTGSTTDYTTSVKKNITEAKSNGKVIVVVKRGTITFKEKMQIAREMGADAIIIYNNVSGMIRVSLQDLAEEYRIPCISVSMDAGATLTGSGSSRISTGTITISRDYEAGPFMNDYSSWGTTSDLNIKPDVTAHGGEITSTVAGGYDEMSGTSMACPNLAGFTALLKSQLKGESFKHLWKTAQSDTANAINLTNLTNNIIMSTATVVYDQNNLPYSPRKQGSGLATMDNAFKTSAYLYTVESDGYRADGKGTMYPDGRPKAELGADADKTGSYTVTFHVNNFGSNDLKFTTNSIFMTETLGADGLSVAEKAHLFSSKGAWTVDGVSVGEGSEITVKAGTQSKIVVTLTLSAEEKQYIETNFVNGMFVEGYLQLLSSTDGQCDLNLPFLAFYGDWNNLQLLDYDCFEVAAFDSNTSYTDDDRPRASVWATQAYSYYYNETYATPLGSFLYVQDEDKEHTSEYVYTSEEHIAISGFNNYVSATSNSNYMTVTGIRALYAGLLRNAELVTYTLTNEDTGEVIKTEDVYRVSRAYAGGGSAAPAVVKLEMRTDELGLEGNGKYRLDFQFYFDYDDYTNGNGTDDTFSMSFYVDYEAPILADSRIRYQDIKNENGKTSQKVYLDLDVYDNHYPQAVLLCYEDGDTTDEEGNTTKKISLATEYITPVLNAKKNDITTVSIEITDLYEEYSGKLYVEVDDYAMNHNVYTIDLSHANSALISDSSWSVAESTVTVAQNSTATVTLNNIGDANLSNFAWEMLPDDDGEIIAEVKNGEVFGITPGTAVLLVSDGSVTREVTIVVTESSLTLSAPTVSFGTIKNADDIPVKASGTVEVNPAQTFQLTLSADPWYYPIENLEFEWTSTDTSLATVDDEGNVVVQYEGDSVKSVTIEATCKTNSSCKASVTLSIQEPFTVSSGTLSKYRGWGGTLTENVTVGGINLGTVRVLQIPSDKAITTIGSEAFSEVEGVEVIVIPKTVTSIKERAFEKCTNLKAICFIDLTAQDVADSSLTLISEDAFRGCTSLRVVDLSNCKVFTVDKNVFTGCTSLEKIVKMTAIGTAYAQSFMGCTSLTSIDISSLHVAGEGLFAGCTSLTEVITGANTAMSQYMFSGCTSLTEVTLECANIPAYAFAAATLSDNYGKEWSFKSCTGLNKVTLASTGTKIGTYAFSGCTSLEEVEITGTVSSVGHYAFKNCTALSEAQISALQTAFASATLGADIFDGSAVAIGEKIVDGKLITAAPIVTSASYLTDNNITEVGSYAFSGSTLSGVETLDLSGVETIGEGAFYGLSGLKQITLPEISSIADYAFANTGLTSVTIPDSVTEIGDYAFYGCSGMAEVTFGGTAAVKEIGAYAFSGSGITSVELPASIKSIGDYAFYDCASLTSATVNSAKTMGDYVFAACPALTTAVLGDGVTDSGDGTFTAYYDRNSTTNKLTMVSALTSVTLGGNLTELGSYMFYGCNELTGINLNRVTTVGDYAFYYCSVLSSAEGIDRVKEFGNYSFYGTALTSVTFTAAEKITYRAFASCASLKNISFGSSLAGLGAEAFAGSSVSAVTIPASCSEIGYSVFTDSSSFMGYTVETGNKNYFSDESGVLYRYVDEDSYELISYPMGRLGDIETDDGEEITSYTVKEGTVSILMYAFAYVPDASLDKVTLPYTLKTIGHGAFYESGITRFVFESIAAPTLLERYNGKTIEDDYSMNSFFYLNFGDGDFLTDSAPHYPGDTSYTASTLTISHPSNGTGYSNFVYSYYFGTVVDSGEYPEDDTRTLIELIDDLPTAEEINSWTQANKTTEEVQLVADNVKEAHRLYNELATDVQTEYVGQERIDKLFAVEEAIKPVKEMFGITVSVKSVAVASTSTHRKEYTVGETFSLEGLMIKVTYDDYSEEIVEAEGNFKLTASYDRGLMTVDTLVMIEGVGDYSGRTVYVRGLTVKDGTNTDNADSTDNTDNTNGADDTDNTNGADSTDNDSEKNATLIAIVICCSVGGVLVLVAAAIAVILFVKKKKAEKTLTETNSGDTAPATPEGEQAESGAEQPETEAKPQDEGDEPVEFEEVKTEPEGEKPEDKDGEGKGE